MAIRPSLAVLCFAAAALASTSNAVATTQVVDFNVLSATATVATPFGVGDTLFLNSLVTTQTGALAQTVSFTVGSGVTGLGGQAAWAVMNATGPGPRVVGVNFDLFDAVSGTLISSDVFGGLLGGYGHSTLGASLAPGSYKLVATGTAPRQTFYDLALTFAGAATASAPAVAALPAAVPLAIGSAVVAFNQLNATATVSTPLGAGDTLFVDTVVTTDTGPLSQTVRFTLDNTVHDFTGSASWMVGIDPGTPRLVGIDLELFDSLDHLIYSDTFAGVLDRMANSTFTGSLGPGSYKLVATGTASRDASLDISLSFTGTPVAVPLPGTPSLIAAGLLCFGLVRAGAGAANLGKKRRST